MEGGRRKVEVWEWWGGEMVQSVPSLSPLYSVWTPAPGMVPLTFEVAHLP